MFFMFRLAGVGSAGRQHAHPGHVLGGPRGGPAEHLPAGPDGAERAGAGGSYVV